jgi:signal peptidase I
MVIFAVYYSNSTSGKPVVLLGFSAMNVLSPSMESVYPVGSVVIVRKVDAKSLEVGNDITYMKDPTTTVTHRIQEIIEDYEGSGARGFRTYGVDNTSPDAEVVHATNIVGKVVANIPKAGLIVEYISDNILVLFIIFGLLILLSFLIRGLLKPQDEPRKKIAKRAL